MAIYDITLPLYEGLPVWPGDRPYRFTWTGRIAEGASVNLGSIALTVHAGTHADAPLHVADAEADIALLDLDAYVGPAVVVDVRGCTKIRVEDVAVEGLACTPRLLLQTGAWIDPTTFPERFPVMEPDVPAYLHEHGVRLVGLDVPSVDAFDSKTLPNHHALNARGIRILESLALNGVPPGRYELIALPLKLVGADGAPVRAILRTLPHLS